MACALWRDLGLPYEEAQDRLLIGAATRALGDEEGAVREIEAAAAPSTARGAAELQCGLRSGPIRLAGRLTTREVDVLRLVAAGRTNRDIAAELVISEHTVCRHLQNIFTKLGVSSRAAATAFACRASTRMSPIPHGRTHHGSGRSRGGFGRRPAPGLLHRTVNRGEGRRRTHWTRSPSRRLSDGLAQRAPGWRNWYDVLEAGGSVVSRKLVLLAGIGPATPCSTSPPGTASRR